MVAKLFFQSPKNNVGNHLKALRDFLDSHSSTYKKVILGDFNVETDDQNMKTFCDSYSLTSLIIQPTCYKTPLCPKFIDLILTNVQNTHKNPTLKAIPKYEWHPRIPVIRTKCKRNGVFSFREVSFKEIRTEILLMKLNKASQYSNTPTKVIKENSDIFSDLREY